MTIDEGYIKFSYDWQEKPTPIEINLSEIIAARKNLWQKGLIGVYPDGIGFGNVSIRTSNNQFLISATQIGHIELLQKEDFSLVTEYDFSKNWLRCIGSKKASSESLTHAAIYECAASIECVLHIHSKVYWQRLLGFLPSTDK
ncbi:MAG: class II aldolase/adducin family protein, partial [bacterium]|nr:class II aldolase/adducin family protein [bacterium]